MSGGNLSLFQPAVIEGRFGDAGQALAVLDAWRGRGRPAPRGRQSSKRRGQNWKGRGLEGTRMSQHEAILTLIGAAVLTAAAGAGVIVLALRLF